MKFWFKIFLFVVIAGSAFPSFVAAATAVGWWLADGATVYDLELLPKRLILQQFIQDMVNSLVIAAPLGLLAVIDYSLLARFSVTRLLSGLSLPLATVTLSYWWFKGETHSLMTGALTGVLLWLIYRIMLIFSPGKKR